MAKQTQKTMTLGEISEATGISMPTLSKYKATAAAQLARFTVGEGRKAKFKPGAKVLFLKLRNEGLARRGKRG